MFIVQELLENNKEKFQAIFDRRIAKGKIIDMIYPYSIISYLMYYYIWVGFHEKIIILPPDFFPDEFKVKSFIQVYNKYEVIQKYIKLESLGYHFNNSYCKLSQFSFTSEFIDLVFSSFHVKCFDTNIRSSVILSKIYCYKTYFDKNLSKIVKVFLDKEKQDNFQYFLTHIEDTSIYSKEYTLYDFITENVNDVNYHEYKEQYCKEFFEKDVYFEFCSKLNIQKLNMLLDLLHEPVKKLLYSLEYSRVEHIYKQLIKLKACVVDDTGTMNMKYYRSEHGRFYLINNPLQQLPKWIRNYLLDDYIDIDMKAAIFSLIYNEAIRENYDMNKLSELSLFLNDPDFYRMEVYNDLKRHDQFLTYDYVKKSITSIAYGAQSSPGVIIKDIENHLGNCSIIKNSGYKFESIPFLFVTNPHIEKLTKELKLVTKWILKKKTVIIDKKRMIRNVLGDDYELKPRQRFGSGLCHIYQGIESTILEHMLEIYIHDKSLKCYPDAIGLLLHDGVYIKAEVLKGVKNIENLFSEYIRKKMNINLKFSVDKP